MNICSALKNRPFFSIFVQALNEEFLSSTKSNIYSHISLVDVLDLYDDFQQYEMLIGEFFQKCVLTESKLKPSAAN